MGEPAIFARFPALRAWPRVQLGTDPTPVERVRVGDRSLLVKRDDRFGDPVGGNKVRGLEWLLGGVRDRDTVVTVGPRGSTHALATAVHARRLGARPVVVRWRQEMNDAARSVDAKTRAAARVIEARWVPIAYAIAGALRLIHPGRVHWIPAGGATPLAVIGHVGAALELADQIARGESERPRRVVVPLGSGGTAAGLWLGFAIAGLPIEVVAVRVVPRIVGRRGRVRRLAKRARVLLRRTGTRVARPDEALLRIEHGYFGGRYGRPLGDPQPPAIAGIPLDDTYSRKALRAALDQPDDGATLLWLTFDGRLLRH